MRRLAAELPSCRILRQRRGDAEAVQATDEQVIFLEESGDGGGDYLTLAWDGKEPALEAFQARRGSWRLSLVAVHQGRRTVLREARFPVLDYSWRQTVAPLAEAPARWIAELFPARAAGHRHARRSLPAQVSVVVPRLHVRVGNFSAAVWRRAFREEIWGLGLVDGEPGHHRWSPASIRWLAHRNAELMADPFYHRNERGEWILYERFSYRTGRKHICWLALAGDAVTDEGPCEGLPEQSSYPFLVEHDGNLYCIPEAHREQEIALYRATEFPRLWRKEATLVPDVPGLDATVVFWQARWWMFHTVAGPTSNYALHLRWADRLKGPWHPHPANPVLEDVTGARPAGTPFVVAGTLYRPAQDCAGRYGRRTVVKRIERLDETGFRETVAAAIAPVADGPYPDGLHTLGLHGNRAAVDGRCYRWRPRLLKESLYYLLRLGGYRDRAEARWRAQQAPLG